MNLTDLRTQIDTLEAEGVHILDPVRAETWIADRTTALVDTRAGLPEYASKPLAALQEQARVDATDEHRQLQRKDGLEFQRKATSVAAVLNAAMAQARTLVVPPVALTDAETSTLSPAEQITVLEMRQLRRSTDQAGAQARLAPLSLEDRLDALDDAQRRGDLVLAEALDAAIAAALPDMVTGYERAQTHKPRARFDTIREARVDPDLARDLAQCQRAFHQAIQAPTAVQARDRIASGDRSNTAINNLFVATRKVKA